MSARRSCRLAAFDVGEAEGYKGTGYKGTTWTAPGPRSDPLSLDPLSLISYLRPLIFYLLHDAFWRKAFLLLHMASPIIHVPHA